jgi:hypothetical protein
MLCVRRVRIGVPVVIVATAVVAALFGLPAPNAQAFFSQPHERIVRAALPPDQVSENAVLQILVGPTPRSWRGGN